MSIFRPLFRKKRAKRPQSCALDANTAAQNPLESILGQVSSVCFIGDSITAGSENGGVHGTPPLSCAILRCGVTHLQPAGVHHPLS